MELINKIQQGRWSLISWTVLPILIVWIATNYLIGELRQPAWNKGQVLGASADAFDQAPKLTDSNDFQWQGSGLVTFWFDDAWGSQYSEGYPVLQQSGFKGTLAIPTKLVGLTSYMNWAQIQQLQFKGWEVTAHTRRHDCSMDQFSQDQIDEEIFGAKDDLKGQGLYVDNYVAPCGVSSPLIMASVKRSYLSFRTSNEGYNPIPVEDPYDLLIQKIMVTTTQDDIQSWVNNAKQNHSWLIIVVHQIDDSKTAYSISPSLFKQTVQIVKNSGLPVITPNQALSIMTQDKANKDEQ